MAEVDLVDVVCPIDQQAAPDHDGEDREIDPVHPADGKGMFRDYLFHFADGNYKERAVSAPFRYHGFITIFPSA